MRYDIGLGFAIISIGRTMVTEQHPKSLFYFNIEPGAAHGNPIGTPALPKKNYQPPIDAATVYVHNVEAARVLVVMAQHLVQIMETES